MRKATLRETLSAELASLRSPLAVTLMWCLLDLVVETVTFGKLRLP